jgi:Zn-dependent protease
MNTLLVRLPEIVVQLLAFALAISVHESAHGWAAEKLGDPTARWLGRITLNPIKHIDPIGTVLFPLMLAVIGAPIIGWAKPVPFVTRNLRNQRRDPALVGASVLVLLVLEGLVPGFRGLLVAVASQGALGATGVIAPLAYLLLSLAMINLILAVFNMIPIPPLDGSHLLAALLPPRAAYEFARLERYGMLLLFALLWTGFLGVLLRPFLGFLDWILFRL